MSKRTNRIITEELLQKVYVFMVTFYKRHGRTATVREIKDQFNLGSTSTVSNIYDALEVNGYLTRGSGGQSPTLDGVSVQIVLSDEVERRVSGDTLPVLDVDTLGLMDVRQVSEYLDVSQTTATRIMTEDLHSTKVWGKWLVSAERVRQYKDHYKQNGRRNPQLKEVVL